MKTNKPLFKMTESQKEAKKTAENLLGGDYVFADTETTGVTNKDQVVEFAFADNTGTMIYHSYYHPTVPMNPEATAVSGITDEMLADKPRFRDEWENIKNILNGRKLVFYNLSFDERMLRKTAEVFNIPKNEVDDIFSGATCSMLLYSKYLGISPWIKMEEGAHAEGINIVQDHLADSDVSMMVKLLEAVADPDTRPSIQNVYENILDPEDKPDYREKKEKNIIKSVISKTVENVSGYLYNHLKDYPDAETFSKVIKDSYTYDLKLSDENKKQIISGAVNKYNAIKDRAEMEKKQYRKYERNAEIVDLYNKGYSLGRISKAKGLSNFYIENILRSEFSRNPGCVDLSQFVDPEFTDDIIRLSKELPTGTKLKPIKESLPDRVSYMNIGTVLVYDAKGRLNELKEKSSMNYYNYDTGKIEKKSMDSGNLNKDIEYLEEIDMEF